jgi:hypothetical protein
MGVMLSRNRRGAIKRACRFHSSVSANRRQAAAKWTGLGARAEALSNFKFLI